MAKFLQDTVEEMAVSADNQENQEETKAFYDFIEKVCFLYFLFYPSCMTGCTKHCRSADGAQPNLTL